MFHAIQDYWLTMKTGYTGMPTQEAYDVSEMPIFREGSADTVANAIGKNTYSDYLATFKARFKELLRSETPELRTINTKEAMASYMKKIEIRSQFSETHEASYLLGMVVFEYAIAKYGFQKYYDLVKTQNKTISFRTAFKNVYGFEIDEMYQESSQYVLSALQILKTS